MAKPLRILIIGPSLDILGGQAVQATRLLARLNKEPSIEVSFLPINPRLPGPLRKLQSIKYVRTVVTSLLYWALLLARVWKHDVIHVFSASYLSFVLAPTPAVLVAKLYGKRTVLNYHSGEARDHLIRWRRTAVPTIRLFDEIAVPSGYLVDVFAQFELAARPIFNFVDTDHFCFRERRPLRPVFLSNRNLEPLYNVGCVLRAFAVVQQRFPEAQLIVAGDGSERHRLETLARDLGLRNIEFAGRVAPQDMPNMLKQADIYLNGSEIDNMPGSIIEAFAAGLPVVTTDAGGIPYMVTDESNGMMVRCRDYEAIAAKAIRLLEESELATRIIYNAREACLEYSWESVRTEWLKLYHGLAGKLQAGQPDETQVLRDPALASSSQRHTPNGKRRVFFRERLLSYSHNAGPASERLTATAAEVEKPARPTRVLIVAPSLDILGGQAVQATRLIARLNEEPTLEVSFLPINPRLPGWLRKLQSIKYVRTVVTSLLYLGLLGARVRKHDVIHVFSASYFSFVLAPTPAVVAAKLYGKKSVLNYRSGRAPDHLRRWRRTAIPTIRLFDEIAVPSGYLVDVFARFELSARPIFNFVDTTRFCFRDRTPLRPVFLSNRNFEALYNVACILRAFSIIQRHMPHASLIVAGDGSQRGELEKLAHDLGLRNIEFTGRVAPENMPALLDRADIFLNSSEIDNMPGSIIEAFAAGLPVVTTDAGGIPYIVRDGVNGLMVRCGDYEAIADRSIRLLEDSELAARMVSSAHEACRHYTWESVRGEWIKLYQGLVRRGGTGREKAAESPVVSQSEIDCRP